MSETVKLIIEIPKDRYTDILRIADVQIIRRMPTLEQVVAHGIPLDDIDSDETRAYFDGQAYGWEQGRKALIDDVKAEIETNLSWDMFDEYGNETGLHKELMEILDNIGKEDKE
jgi:hypothetical protein